MIRPVWGRGAIPATRTPIRKACWEPGERDRLDEEAATQSASEAHPLMAGLVSRQGLDRLCRLSPNDPDWGEANRKRLKDDWEEHVDLHEHREVAALVATRFGRGELGKVNPFLALPAIGERLAS